MSRMTLIGHTSNVNGQQWPNNASTRQRVSAAMRQYARNCLATIWERTHAYICTYVPLYVR